MCSQDSNSDKSRRRFRWLLLLVFALALLVTALALLPRRPQLPPGISRQTYDAAADAFRAHYHREPDHYDLLSWIAEGLAEQNELAASIICLEGIPTDHSSYGHLARFQQAYHFAALNRARQSEIKIREFLRAESKTPQLAPQQYLDGLRLLRFLLETELRFEERVAVLDEIHAMGRADTFETLASCFPSLLRWNGPSAISWHRRFWKEDPNDFHLRVALGRYRLGQGELEESRKILAACCKEESESLHAQAAYLDCLRELGEWELIGRALAQLPPVNAAEPWLLLSIRGRYHNQRKQFDRAARCFQMLLRQDPANAEAYGGLAKAFAGLGQTDAREAASQRSNVLARIQNRLGWILFHEDEIEPLLEVSELCHDISLDGFAWQIAEFARQLDPNHAGSKQLLARLDAAGSHVNSTQIADLASVEMNSSSGDETRSVAQNPDGIATRADSEAQDSTAKPFFEQIAKGAGIDFHRYDDMRGLHRIIETTGGGVALFDFDGDGWLDIFFTNGCRIPRGDVTGQYSNQFYRNLGNGQFEQVTADTGLQWEGYCQGCAVGDYDGDGFDDLYVAAFGSNRFYRNNGDGTFSDFTDRTATEVYRWNSSAAFADVNCDGHLDLYVVGYVQEDPDSPTLCPEPASPDGYISCPPTMYPAAEDVLFLSDGQGGFQDLSRQAGITGVDGKGLGIVVSDVDQDGWPDIYVANDGTPNHLYLNRTTVTNEEAGENHESLLVPAFEEEAAFWGAAVNDSGRAESSMGVAFGDYDGDGWIDLLLTHYYMGTNTLYRNMEGEGFEDVTSRTQLAAPSRAKLSWGTQFMDFENDGWLDLMVVSGHIDDMRWGPGNPPYAMHPQVFRNNRKGRFVDMSRWAGSYFVQEWLGRGLATGDLDHDGDVDVAVSHQLTPSAVLRNDTETDGKSIVIRLIGRGRSNRSAINARVATEGDGLKIVREIVGGGSYQSACDRSVHIGLGSLPEIRNIEISWPSGAVDNWENVLPGAYTAIEQQGLYRRQDTADRVKANDVTFGQPR